jgi:hypothetical protein
MKKIIAWFAANGVAANLLMVFIVVMGLMTLTTVKQEVFPELSPDAISVSVLYPGAAPEEVEDGIVIRIEEKIQALDDIKEISSVSAENVGTVIIELVQGADGSEVLNEVKARVDSIDTFPEEAEEPLIEEVLIRRQVISVAVSGPAEERTLKAIGERVRDGGGATTVGAHLRAGGTRHPTILFRSSRRLDRDLRRRDSATNRGSGLSGARVREPATPHAGRWEQALPGRRGPHQRRIRGNRPIGTIRWRVRGHGAGVPRR